MPGVRRPERVAVEVDPPPVGHERIVGSPPVTDVGGEVRLGSMLFTLVEPHRGHEVAYNRWYERDHFYAGCMVGPWLFAGRRFVATRALKDLRFGSDADLFGGVGARLVPRGVLDPRGPPRRPRGLGPPPGAVAARQRPHVRRARPHPHAAVPPRVDRPRRGNGAVPAELALDHPFGGLTATLVRPAAGVTATALGDYVRDRFSPELELGFSPIPLPPDAPVSQQGHDRLDGCLLNLSFTAAVAGHVVGRAASGGRRARGRRRRRDALDGPVHPDDPGHRHLHRPAVVSGFDRLLSPGPPRVAGARQPHRAEPDGHEPRRARRHRRRRPGGLVRGPGTRRRRPADRRVGRGGLSRRVHRRPPDRRVRRRAPPGAAAPGRRRPPPRRRHRRPARAQRHAEPARHRRGPTAAGAVEEAATRARRALRHAHAGGVGGGDGAVRVAERRLLREGGHRRRSDLGGRPVRRRRHPRASAPGSTASSCTPATATSLHSFLTPEQQPARRPLGRVGRGARRAPRRGRCGRCAPPLGPTFPLWARIGAFEAHRDPGQTMEDSLVAMGLAVDAGLDAIHVTAYGEPMVATGITDGHTPHEPGALLPYAASGAARARRAGDRDGSAHTRGRRAGARRRSGRRDRHGSRAHRRPRPAEQAPRGSPRPHPTLRLPVPLHRRDLPQRAGPVRGEPRRRARGASRDETTDAPAPHRGGRRRPRRASSAPAGSPSVATPSSCTRPATASAAGSALAEAADPDLAGLLDWLVGAAEDAGVTIHLGSPVVEPPDADVLVWAVGAPWPGSGHLGVDDLAAWLVDGPAPGRPVVVRGQQQGRRVARRARSRPRGRRRPRPGRPRCSPRSSGCPGASACVAAARARRRRHRRVGPADAATVIARRGARRARLRRPPHPEVHVIGDAAGTGMGLAAAALAHRPPTWLAASAPCRTQAVEPAGPWRGCRPRWQPARWSSTRPADCMNA